MRSSTRRHRPRMRAIQYPRALESGTRSPKQPGVGVYWMPRLRGAGGRKRMHGNKWIRDNPDAFDRALARRGLAAEAKRLIEIDERRRAAIQKARAGAAARSTA